MSDEKIEHIVLEDGGAQAIWVSVDHDGMLQIENMVFTENETRKLRDFLNKNFGE